MKCFMFLLMLVITFTVPECIYANPVRMLTVFRNFWYGSVATSYLDACNKFHNTYYNKNTDPAAVAKAQLPSGYVAAYKCTWTNPEMDGNMPDYLPRDFPGNQNDTDQIYASGGNVTQYWRVRCLTADGKSVLEPVSTTVFPAYTCPAGTNYSINQAGCYTASVHICESDVEGRDLDTILPWLQKQGHVAITELAGDASTGESANVLEVLNTPPPVIKHDTLLSFETITKFWGEVYGLSANNPEYHRTTAQAIYGTGYEQLNFNPKYTYLPIYVPGNYTKKIVYDSHNRTWMQALTYTQAEFRCDTFVIYCYYEAVSSILPTSGIISPLDVYNSFSYTREPSEKIPQKRLSSNRLMKTSHAISSADSIIILRQLLTKEFNKKYLISSDVDKISEAFVKNKNTTAAQKSEFLWSMATKYTADPDKFNYLVDMISFIGSTSVTSRMVNFYQANNKRLNQSEKLNLLSTLSRIVSNRSSAEQFKQQGEQGAKKVVAVQQLFETLLSKAQDKQVIRQAILLYPNTVPPKQAYILVNRAKIRAKQLFGQPVLTINEEITQNFEIAFSTKAMQADLLPSLLKYAHYLSASDKIAFNNTLYFIIKQLDPKDINKAIQSILLEYLEIIKPNDQQVLQQQYPYNIAFCWLSSYAKIKFLDSTMSQYYITSTIVHAKDINRLATLIAGADQKTLAALGKGRLKLIYFKIKQSSYKKQLSGIDRLALEKISTFYVTAHPYFR